MALTPIKLLRGDVLGKLVESFAGFADLGGGGGASVQATYGGTNVSIANGASGNLTFDSLVSGTELLDRTDPANPTFLAEGTYAFSYSIVSSAPLTAGGYVWAAAEIGMGDAPFTTAHPEIHQGTSFVFKASAGDPLDVRVLNRDGVSTRLFSLNAAILVKID